MLIVAVNGRLVHVGFHQRAIQQGLIECNASSVVSTMCQSQYAQASSHSREYAKLDLEGRHTDSFSDSALTAVADSGMIPSRSTTL